MTGEIAGSARRHGPRRAVTLLRQDHGLHLGLKLEVEVSSRSQEQEGQRDFSELEVQGQPEAWQARNPRGQGDCSVLLLSEVHCDELPGRELVSEGLCFLRFSSHHSAVFT